MFGAAGKKGATEALRTLDSQATKLCVACGQWSKSTHQERRPRTKLACGPGGVMHSLSHTRSRWVNVVGALKGAEALKIMESNRR